MPSCYSLFIDSCAHYVFRNTAEQPQNIITYLRTNLAAVESAFSLACYSFRVPLGEYQFFEHYILNLEDPISDLFSHEFTRRDFDRAYAEAVEFYGQGEASDTQSGPEEEEVSD